MLAHLPMVMLVIMKPVSQKKVGRSVGIPNVATVGDRVSLSPAKPSVFPNHSKGLWWRGKPSVWILEDCGQPQYFRRLRTLLHGMIRVATPNMWCMCLDQQIVLHNPQRGSGRVQSYLSVSQRTVELAVGYGWFIHFWPWYTAYQPMDQISWAQPVDTLELRISVGRPAGSCTLGNGDELNLRDEINQHHDQSATVHNDW